LALVLAALGGAVLPLASGGGNCACCGATGSPQCAVGWLASVLLILPFVFFGAAAVLVHFGAGPSGQEKT
jgi:hypothetical protein